MQDRLVTIWSNGTVDSVPCRWIGFESSGEMSVYADPLPQPGATIKRQFLRSPSGEECSLIIVHPMREADEALSSCG